MEAVFEFANSYILTGQQERLLMMKLLFMWIIVAVEEVKNSLPGSF